MARKRKPARPPAPKPLAVHVRWMIRRDFAEVQDIERASFEQPWDEETFVKLLRQRNCIGMVAECEETIRGFMIYRLHKQALELLNLAVDPLDRRRGVGRSLVEKMVGKLSYQRRSRIRVAVDERSLGAHLFLRDVFLPQRGFRAIGLLPEHYHDGPAIEFQYLYQPSEEEHALGVNRLARRDGRGR